MVHELVGKLSVEYDEGMYWGLFLDGEKEDGQPLSIAAHMWDKVGLPEGTRVPDETRPLGYRWVYPLNGKRVKITFSIEVLPEVPREQEES